MKQISAAIVRAQAEIRSAQKSGDNKFDKYNYSKLEDFFAAAKPAMAAHGLALVVSVKNCESLPDRPTKNGGLEHACRVTLEGMLIHESGECITMQGCGEGQDRADKALYKAITGGKKYLIASLFSIPTTDDPEADETVGLSVKGAEAPKKIDSKGEVKKKKTVWTDQEMAMAGEMGREIAACGDMAKKEYTDLWHRVAYDLVEDALHEITSLKNKWLDIQDQANQGVPS